MKRIATIVVCVGCTQTPTTETKPEPIVAEAHGKPKSCESLISHYESTRTKLNVCERDNDCAEIWPGLCPHGPYYIRKSASLRDAVELEREIEERCEIPECEPPVPMGPARCLDGVCKTGRAVPDDGTCWDTPVDYIEFGQRRSLNAQPVLKAPTPLTGIGVATAGELELKVTWQECERCELQISEHNLGMSRLVQGRRTTEGQVQTIVIDATPGPYYLYAKGRGAFDLVANFAHEADRHGEVHYRVCED